MVVTESVSLEEVPASMLITLLLIIPVWLVATVVKIVKQYERPSRLLPLQSTDRRGHCNAIFSRWGDWL